MLSVNGLSGDISLFAYYSEFLRRGVRRSTTRSLRVWHTVQRSFSGQKVDKRRVTAYRARVPASSYVDSVRFFVRYLKSPTSVGALLPSSIALAEQITSAIPEGAREVRILEVGPGTGPFTDAILKKIGEESQLHLVELDEVFARGLREKYKGHPNVRVFHQNILDHPEEFTYDHVVVGVPFGSLTKELTEEIFEKLKRLSEGGATISFFEYLFLPRIKSMYSREAVGIMGAKSSFYNECGTGTANVFYNVPPARVVHHKMRKLSRANMG